MSFKLDRTAFAVTTLQGQNADALPYWLSRPIEERLAAVEYLRRQQHGTGAKLQRVMVVIERAPR